MNVVTTTIPTHSARSKTARFHGDSTHSGPFSGQFSLILPYFGHSCDMDELLTANPTTVAAFRSWLTQAANEIEPQIDRASLGEFNKPLQSFVAQIVRRAKLHAFRLGLYKLADKLPERQFKTPLDGLLRLRECARRRVKPKSRLTPPDVAKRYGVSPDTVRLWIEQGDLEAMNVAKRGATRPRYRIEPDALAKFDKRRVAKSAPTPGKRRRKKASDLLVTRFSDGP